MQQKNTGVSDQSTYLPLGLQMPLSTMQGTTAFMRQHPEVACVTAAGYIWLVHAGQKWMAPRQRMELKATMAAWNALLSVVSAVGFVSLLGDSTTVLSKGGLDQVICTSEEENLSPVVMLFCLSKFPELLDTAFMVARKRPVPLLHWYHHSSVLVFCWFAWAYQNPVGGAFALMNMLVHTVMYAYFAVSAYGWLRHRIVRMSITGLQILQMLAGLGLLLLALGRCNASEMPTVNMGFGILMYLSYALLFGHFFAQQYLPSDKEEAVPQTDRNWSMLAYLSVCHVLALAGLYVAGDAQWSTHVLAAVLWPISGFGITGGAHRLWSHRSYKASAPFRLVVMLMNSIANQGSILHWSRDHRLHHKHSETDADPHNARRGFWFSHVGWLLRKKNASVKQEGKKIDISDLQADPIVMVQHRLDPWWNLMMCFALPTLLGTAMGDSWLHSLLIVGFLRYVVVLHFTWLVNSAAHLWGSRPYDASSNPAENFLVAVASIGEGWHNWHHKYPFDYAASEFGVLARFNPTKLLIDGAAAVGLVWDRKRATKMWERDKMRQHQDASRLEKSLKGE